MQDWRKIVLPLNFCIYGKQLHEAIYSIRPVLDKRLRAEIRVPREMLKKKEINSVKWISREEQLANCLMKRCDSLLNVLSPVKED